MDKQTQKNIISQLCISMAIWLFVEGWMEDCICYEKIFYIVKANQQLTSSKTCVFLEFTTLIVPSLPVSLQLQYQIIEGRENLPLLLLMEIRHWLNTSLSNKTVNCSKNISLIPDKYQIAYYMANVLPNSIFILC